MITGPTNLGWECPKCGNCYSPTVPQCTSCAINPYVSPSNPWTITPVEYCTCTGFGGYCAIHGWVGVGSPPIITWETTTGNTTSLEVQDDDEDPYEDLEVSVKAARDFYDGEGKIPFVEEPIMPLAVDRTWKSPFAGAAQEMIDAALEALENPPDPDLTEVKAKIAEDKANDCGCSCTQGPCPRKAKKRKLKVNYE